MNPPASAGRDARNVATRTSAANPASLEMIGLGSAFPDGDSFTTGKHEQIRMLPAIPVKRGAPPRGGSCWPASSLRRPAGSRRPRQPPVHQGLPLRIFRGMRPANGVAGQDGVCFISTMAIFSSASAAPGTAAARTDGAKKATSDVRAAQTLAKQKSLERSAKKYKLPLGELTMFTQQLASLLVAGLPLVQCLEALQDQTEDPRFRIIIRDVRLDISQGNSFSSSVKKFPRAFPTLFISMVEAGEASGGLAEILGKVAGYFEATLKLTKKVKSAMAYPIGVISLAIVLVNVLLIFVIPVFAAMFADFGAKLPMPTQVLIDVSHFMGHYFLVIAAACVGIWYGMKKLLATPRGRRVKDQFLVRAPIFGN